MNTASNVSQSARDGLKEAREGVREAGSAAAAASPDIQTDLQKDLQALRDDFGRLAEEVSAILSSKGNAAWRQAKTGVDGVVSGAQAKGQEAVGAVREVSDHFVEAIDQSIKERPYATLAIAAALGFVLGAAWRR